MANWLHTAANHKPRNVMYNHIMPSHHQQTANHMETIEDK